MKTQKEPVLIKYILFLCFSFFSFLSFGQRDYSNDDFKILDVLWDKDSYDLNPENSTFEVINSIDILKKIELEGNEFKIDSLKKLLNIIDSGIIENFKVNYGIMSEKNKPLYKKFQEIFNRESYENMLGQEHSGEWNALLTKESRNKPLISISKPIFTKNNKWAFVSYKKKNVFGILILHKESEYWKEYKIIAPMFLTPRAKFIND